MSYEEKMVLETIAYAASLIGLWVLYWNKDKLVEFERRMGIDFTADLIKIGHWLVSFALLLWYLLSIMASGTKRIIRKLMGSIKTHTGKRKRLVYVRNANKIGIYTEVRG